VSQAVACPCSEVKVPGQAPSDIDYIKGLEFTKTEEYRKEFSSATDSARKFCEQYLKEHPDERNLAIVSDLDETLLDNREEFKEHPNHDWGPFDAWLKEAKAPALKETMDFLTWARKQGFAIFFVTGRPAYDRLPTIENLVKIGVAYDGLYLRPPGPKEPTVAYKTGARESIEKMGFKIVVSIGDQYSDLAGGHALDCEKLPNHMYFLP